MVQFAHKMDVSTVDDVLINSFGMSDLENIDIDKYQKGIFSPSPKTATATTPSPTNCPAVSSPEKSVSPHVVPNYTHHSPQRGTQARQQSTLQQFSNQQVQIAQPQIQRKVHLGPHFDRLGILNQANEIPPMTAPFFAKALQQHGSTTLGAILQAHQHVLQQQMQRENFMIQQAAQQQIFQQGFTMNNIYAHQQQQQRISSVLLERRTDDQIVPNPQILPAQDGWLQQHHAHFHQGKHFRVKREADIDVGSARYGGRKSKNKRTRKEAYVIFNEDCSKSSNEMPINEEDDEEKSSLIPPPKNSVFVRYKSETNKSLPSFTEAFSCHLDKLKMKEVDLRVPNGKSLLTQSSKHQICQRSQLEAQKQQQLVQESTQNKIIHYGEQRLSSQLSNSQISDEKSVNKEEDVLLLNDSFQLVDEVQVSSELIAEESHVDADTKKDSNSNQLSSNVSSHLAKETKICREKTHEDVSYSYLDFLNDVGKHGKDLFSYNEGESGHRNKAEQNNVKSDLSHLKQEIEDAEKKEMKQAADAIGIFSGDLELNNGHSYDNLFNGNSDEHYFQAFKDNNMHLVNDLNENKVDNGDDVLKLLHSPLDFLNEKFLR